MSGWAGAVPGVWGGWDQSQNLHVFDLLPSQLKSLLGILKGKAALLILDSHFNGTSSNEDELAES